MLFVSIDVCSLLSLLFFTLLCVARGSSFENFRIFSRSPQQALLFQKLVNVYKDNQLHAFISDYIYVKTVQSSMQPNRKQLNWKLSGVVEREAVWLKIVERRGWEVGEWS